MKIHLYAIRLGRPLTQEETETLMRKLPPERRGVGLWAAQALRMGELSALSLFGARQAGV